MRWISDFFCEMKGIDPTSVATRRDWLEVRGGDRNLNGVFANGRGPPTFVQVSRGGAHAFCCVSRQRSFKESWEESCRRKASRTLKAGIWYGHDERMKQS